MSTKGLLYNAALFALASSPSSPLSSPLTFDMGLHLPYANLALKDCARAEDEDANEHHQRPSVQADVVCIIMGDRSVLKVGEDPE
jgi:hypothetical protein